MAGAWYSPASQFTSTEEETGSQVSFFNRLLTGYSGVYVDLSQIIADLQTVAQMIQSTTAAQGLIYASYPRSPEGLSPGDAWINNGVVCVVEPNED